MVQDLFERIVENEANEPTAITLTINSAEPCAEPGTVEDNTINSRVEAVEAVVVEKEPRFIIPPRSRFIMSDLGESITSSLLITDHLMDLT